MGVKDRRARQKTLLRQQILDAARELLVRDGYEKLSMRRVAERIDYSPAIYLHFKDKQELVSSLCEETFARLVCELETLPDECPDPIVRLRKGMERSIAFGLKHPDHDLPTFVLPLPDHLDAERKEAAVQESNGMRATWTRQTSRGCATGRRPTSPPTRSASAGLPDGWCAWGRCWAGRTCGPTNRPSGSTRKSSRR
jgi:AcrR family transcriptional regulator